MRSASDGSSQLGTPVADDNFAAVDEFRPQNAKLVSPSPRAVHVFQGDVQAVDVMGYPVKHSAEPMGQIDLAVPRHLHAAGT